MILGIVEYLALIGQATGTGKPFVRELRPRGREEPR